MCNIEYIWPLTQIYLQLNHYHQVTPRCTKIVIDMLQMNLTLVLKYHDMDLLTHCTHCCYVHLSIGHPLQLVALKIACYFFLHYIILHDQSHHRILCLSSSLWIKQVVVQIYDLGCLEPDKHLCLRVLKIQLMTKVFILKLHALSQF